MIERHVEPGATWLGVCQSRKNLIKLGVGVPVRRSQKYYFLSSDKLRVMKMGSATFECVPFSFLCWKLDNQTHKTAHKTGAGSMIP